MVSSSKAVVPTISDQATALQLTNFTKKLATALAELKTAAIKVCIHFHSMLQLRIVSCCVILGIWSMRPQWDWHCHGYGSCFGPTIIRILQWRPCKKLTAVAGTDNGKLCSRTGRHIEKRGWLNGAIAYFGCSGNKVPLRKCHILYYLGFWLFTI